MSMLLARSIFMFIITKAEPRLSPVSCTPLDTTGTGIANCREFRLQLVLMDSQLDMVGEWWCRQLLCTNNCTSPVSCNSIQTRPASFSWTVGQAHDHVAVAAGWKLPLQSQAAARGTQPHVRASCHTGTELGGSYLSGTMLQPQAPSTFSTPTLGTALVLLSADGTQSHHLSNSTSPAKGEVALAPPMLGSSQRLLNRDHHQIYFQVLAFRLSFAVCARPLRRRMIRKCLLIPRLHHDLFMTAYLANDLQAPMSASVATGLQLSVLCSAVCFWECVCMVSGYGKQVI